MPHAAITDADGAPRELRFSQANLAAWAGKPILLGIRPEAITDPEGADRKSGNIQPCRQPRDGDRAGGVGHLRDDDPVAARTSIARMRADAAVAPGQVFDFAVNMEKAVAFDPATEERIAP